MAKTTLKIEGMTCDHCVNAVQKALSRVNGVEKAEVSLADHQALLTYAGTLDIPAVVKAVEEEGYKAIPGVS